MREGEQFLHEKDTTLHTTAPVENTQRKLRSKGEEVSQKPSEKIEAYLKRMESILNPPAIEGKESFDRKSRNIEMLKRPLFDKVIIKPENVPENYWDMQRRIIINEGRGGDFEKDEQGKILIPEEIREQATRVLISDQEQSLDKWIDYLTSNDANVYPSWAKYWAFSSILKMGKLEKKEDEHGNESSRFQKRTQDTVSAFPPLNPRALAMTIGVIKERAEEKQKPKNERKPAENKSIKLDEKQFQSLLSTENFSKIYGQFLVEMPEYSAEGLKETKGKWVKYPQGSDGKQLVKSLEGHPLEWCTANPDTARTQLQGGDFYVYYSYAKDDEPENPTVPRLAIRMEGNKIAEPPRGIAADQNLDPYIFSVLEKKLKEFGPEGEAFKKRSGDTKRLTELGLKAEKNQELTKDELIFLYEMDSKIDGFGYQKDPRIKELREQRNQEKDMLIIFECEPSQVAHNPKEITKNTKAYVGKLEPGIFELAQIYNIEHIYTSFPEGNIRRMQVEIGGKTKQELAEEMKKQGIKTSSYAQDMLNNKDFNVLENQEKASLVRLKVSDLGFESGATTQEIYQRAEEFGLELCPAEVGPQLRLQYTNQPMGEWISIGMKQIAGRDGYPDVFDLRRNADGLWLYGDLAEPDGRWSSDGGFVFRLRKFSKT